MALKWVTLPRHVAIALTVACAKSAWSVELTDNTWEAETANKSVMAFFHDPDSQQSMEFKPKWDRLEYFYRNKSDSVVVLVNCADEGGSHSKNICKKSLFSSGIYYGRPPKTLEEYTDEKTWPGIEQLASKELGTVCTPNFLEACDEVMKAQIQKLEQMTTEDLKTAVEATEEAVEQAQNTVDDEIRKVQQRLFELKTKTPRLGQRVEEARGDYLMRAVLDLKDPFFEVVLEDEEDFSMEEMEGLARLEEKLEKKLRVDSEEGESTEEDESVVEVSASDEGGMPEEGEYSSENDADSIEKEDVDALEKEVDVDALEKEVASWEDEEGEEGEKSEEGEEGETANEEGTESSNQENEEQEAADVKKRAGHSKDEL